MRTAEPTTELETSVLDAVDDVPGPAAPSAAAPDSPAETALSPWDRYSDPARRRRWYTDDELAGDILGTVRPRLSARGTRSRWEARHRGGAPAYHLSGKGR